METIKKLKLKSKLDCVTIVRKNVKGMPVIPLAVVCKIYPAIGRMLEKKTYMNIAKKKL